MRWCEQALAEHHDPLFVADVEMVRARSLTWLDPARTVEDTVRAADAVLPARPRAGGTAVPRGERAADHDGASVRHGADRRPRPRHRRPHPLGLASTAHAYALRGRWAEAHPALDELLRIAPDADPLWDAQALVIGAQASAFLERFDDGRRLLGSVIATARGAGAPLILGFALTVRAELEWWAGRWPAAYADATEGAQWADEQGQAGNRGFGLVVLARVDGVRGDVVACRAHGEEALQAAVPLGIATLTVYAAAALGSGALAAGEPATAAAHLQRARRLFDEQGAACPSTIPFAGNLVEALVRTGDRAAAEDAVGWVADAAERTGSAYAEAVAARGRGLLADDPDEAETWFTTAQAAHGRLAAPYERARTVLAHAEVLRRGRRPGVARPLLLEAEAAFSALGAHPWTERTRSELAAAGYRGAPGEGSASLDALTPQEFQIARGVAEGLSNVEVAEALFVSRKTVEAHLTRTYRKLGVRSRTELVTEFARRRGIP